MRERILLVDDEQAFCLTLKRALEKRGYVVETAFNGQEAIERARQGRFDLMVVDVRMPDINGLEALQAVKELQPRIEGIVVTGYASYEAPVQAIKLGVRDYLGKPFELKDFVEAIERVLSQSRRAREKARAAQRTRSGYMESLKWLAQEWEESVTDRSSPAPQIADAAAQAARRLGMSAEKVQQMRDLAYLSRLGRRHQEPLSDWTSTHPYLLCRVLEPVDEFRPLLPILLSLYERYDGSGFPEGLRGDDIPLATRILGGAQALIESGAETLTRESGVSLDPEVVGILRTLEPDGDPLDASSPSSAGLEDRGLALARLAAACRQAGDRKTALLALEEAGRLAAEAGDRRLQASCAISRAQILWNEGAPEGALQAAGLALQWAQAEGGLQLAEVTAEVGRVRALAGQREAAEEALLSSLSQFKRWHSHYQSARVALYLADLHRRSRVAESRGYLDQALELATLQGSNDLFLWEWEVAGPLLADALDAGHSRAEQIVGILDEVGPPVLRLWPDSARVPEAVRRLASLREVGDADGGTGPALRILCLGDFAAFRNQERIKEDQWHGRKVKNLLALLLLNRGRSVSSDVILETFWPESTEEKGRHNLHMTVHRMRKALEPDGGERGNSRFIIQQAESYSFNMESHPWVDVDAFENRFAEGRSLMAAGDRTRALAAFVEAERLYGGDYLQNALYEEWCMEPREALRRKQQDLLMFIATEHLHAAHPEMAEAYARKLILSDNTREDSYRLLMRILWNRGHRDEAVKTFQQCEKLLRNELGVTPLPETLALFNRIKDGQPV